jgi:DNA polymerase-3 subunit epsilon
VLETCCRTARLSAPQAPYECTVRLARKTWNLFPTKLPDVCRHLGIPLRHHDAASDAHACARIVLAAANPRQAAVR